MVETSIAATSGGATWAINPTNTFASIVLTILFIYLFFRHFIFMLMISDLVIGWLRQFNWFPKEGRRLKAFIHWLIALVLFLGFLLLSSVTGWIDHIRL